MHALPFKLLKKVTEKKNKESKSCVHNKTIFLKVGSKFSFSVWASRWHIIFGFCAFISNEIPSNSSIRLAWYLLPHFQRDINVKQEKNFNQTIEQGTFSNRKYCISFYHPRELPKYVQIPFPWKWGWMWQMVLAPLQFVLFGHTHPPPISAAVSRSGHHILRRIQTTTNSCKENY